LNDEIVIDGLTDEEENHCCQLGVIRPVMPGYPIFSGGVAIGIRRALYMSKLDRGELPDSDDAGVFGKRPLGRDDLTINDVLSALRLFKSTHICATGFASRGDAPWSSSGTSYRLLGQWPYVGTFELSEAEVPHFLDLWRLLENGAMRLRFNVERLANRRQERPQIHPQSARFAFLARIN
jgi:hypothetical protein